MNTTTQEDPDQMEMPCLCDCGRWFDLLDGHGSIRRPTIVICEDCYHVEEEEQEHEEKIKDAEIRYGDAQVELEDARKELERLSPNHPALRTKPDNQP